MAAVVKDLLAEMRRYDEFFSESVLGMDSKEYVREYWRTYYREGREIGHRPVTWKSIGRGDGLPGSGYVQGQLAGFLFLLEVSGFPFWLAVRMVAGRIAGLTRPKYYDADNARRRDFRARNRRIEPRTTRNPQPDPDEIVEAFSHAKDSAEAMIRFGSLMDDLECHLDNSLMFNEYGRIVGRKGGVRQYLRHVIPELYPRYKTIMRYRLIAKNFRRACKGGDPVPPADYLPPEADGFAPSDGAAGTASALPDENVTPHVLIPGGGNASRTLAGEAPAAGEGSKSGQKAGLLAERGGPSAGMAKRHGEEAPNQTLEGVGAESREIAARILAGWKGTILSLVVAVGKELASREEDFVAAGRRSSGEGRAARLRKRLFGHRVSS